MAHLRRRDVADCGDFGYLSRNYDHVFEHWGAGVRNRSATSRRDGRAAAAGLPPASLLLPVLAIAR
ncbi:hypothetical protein EAO73_28690 [Streptomyces sp. col6]|nr:hypothetical protein EAO73_28690 [Streptomyces sp. col6]